MSDKELAFSSYEGITRLAESLHLKMARINPNGAVPWDDLDENGREAYRAAVRDLLLEKAILSSIVLDPKDQKPISA